MAYPKSQVLAARRRVTRNLPEELRGWKLMSSSRFFMWLSLHMISGALVALVIVSKVADLERLDRWVSFIAPGFFVLVYNLSRLASDRKDNQALVAAAERIDAERSSESAADR